MKKFIAIILLVCYSFSSLGLSVNFFYCCGKLKSVSIKEQAQNCPKPDVKPLKTSCCNNKKSHTLPAYGDFVKKKCCENKQVSLNLNIDQKDQQDALVNLANKSFTFVPLFNFQQLTADISPTPIVYSYKSPPQALLSDKHIFFCVFRI